MLILLILFVLFCRTGLVVIVRTITKVVLVTRESIFFSSVSMFLSSADVNQTPLIEKIIILFVCACVQCVRGTCKIKCLRSGFL